MTVSSGTKADGAAAPLPHEKPFVVMVSAKFILLGLLSSMLLAFSVGRAARIIILEGPRRALFAAHLQSTLRNRPDYHDGYVTIDGTLPPPIAKKGTDVPKTVYTSKNFDTARSATSSSLLIRRGEEDGGEAGDGLLHVCAAREDGTKQCSRGRTQPAADKFVASDDEDDEHLPAGQHLLVDMQHVEGAFLNSEERLASAMVQVIDEASLTLLSYHCHRLIPSGVSCVGVLLESHMSFHTWPGEGVITLDLFTCGSNPLLPVVPIIERLFGVPHKGSSIKVRWAHKLRGFRPLNSNPLETWDLGVHILGDIDLEMKNSVVSVRSDFQQIDVVDVIIPRFNSIGQYRRSLTADGSYESLHPEFFQPDRIVFLDGTMQSRRQGDAPYHEGLVHPGMFVHSNPERVAIIGGGEGATLREVLKHNTVKEAIMIEIDEVMVNVSRKYLPEWSDCSDLQGSAAWCGDDPRSRMFYEDALEWFRSRYGNEDKTDQPIDVIIMDALDPETDIPFAKALYDDLAFLKALYNGLSDDGVIVMQLGASAESDDPPELRSRMKNRAKLFTLIEEAGFASVHTYEESHCGFFNAWSYAVAFKQYETRERWYLNEAEINVAIHQRGIETKSGASPFRYFDGATMVSYQIPSKTTEVVFCRQEPTPEECSSQHLRLDMELPNVPLSSFEVRKSEAAPQAGRGLFTNVDIAQGSYIGAEDNVHDVRASPSSHDLMLTLEDHLDEAIDLFYVKAYAEGYGFWHMIYGEEAFSVDCGVLTFVNHGCNGTSNMGSENATLTELTADPNNRPPDMTSAFGDHASSVYSPFVDRHLLTAVSGPDQALRNLRAGEELLTDYMHFVGHGDAWAPYLKLLRGMCSGEAGEVTEYEQMYEEEETAARADRRSG